MKKTTLAILIASAMAAPVMAAETTEALEVTADTVVVDSSGFWSDASINATTALWIRDRDRKDAATGEMEDNLTHGSVYGALDFSSGFVNNKVGVDLGFYGTADLYNDAGTGHEMNFFPGDPDRPSDAVWSEKDANGVSYYKANVKFQDVLGLHGNLGYFQPSVPSALGVNWSFAPGTYRGAQIGGEIAGIQLGLVYSDNYKAPWIKNTYEFLTSAGEKAGDVYSIGARTKLASIDVDVAYAGVTDGPRKIGHVKTAYASESGLSIKGQVYVISDDEYYDGTAFQGALLTAYSTGAYTVRAEATYAVAESVTAGTVGSFNYRPTAGYGDSNGAYDIWWNNRSDFNHDGEIAFFGSLSRDMADIGVENLSVGASGVYAFGSKGDNVEELTEAAVSVFANYKVGSANLGLHLTKYDNGTDIPSWNTYENAFQDETDLKFTVVVPFSIK